MATKFNPSFVGLEKTEEGIYVLFSDGSIEFMTHVEIAQAEKQLKDGTYLMDNNNKSL